MFHFMMPLIAKIICL